VVVTARGGVACEPLQYILVVVTPVQVFLLALTFPDNDVSKPVTIVLTDISVPTDGVGMSHVVGTKSGRIFLAGEDGCLYELTYFRNEDSGLFASLMGDRPTKTRKINHTASTMRWDTHRCCACDACRLASLLFCAVYSTSPRCVVTIVAVAVSCYRRSVLQALVGTRFLSSGLPLVKVVVDHDRSLLYTLAIDGEIKVRWGARGGAWWRVVVLAPPMQCARVCRVTGIQA
jgi:hypothetical protein